ncbi:hypothetical protein [uncultured Gammaproteobacteria bacterium]|nr:hypothetical protein [uncultured Gammaproteobacteria bacterium]
MLVEQIKDAIEASYLLYLDTIDLANRLNYDLKKINIEFEDYSENEYHTLTDDSDIIRRTQSQIKKFSQGAPVNLHLKKTIQEGLENYKQKLESKQSDEEHNDNLQNRIFSESNVTYEHLSSSETCEYVCQKTIDSFSDYIAKYDIETNSVDNYKIRYFMGMSIVESLKNSGYNKSILDISRLLLLAVMQRTLLDDHEDGLADDMFKKFAITLIEDLEDPIVNYFGEIGLYLIFKSVYKAVK